MGCEKQETWSSGKDVAIHINLAWACRVGGEVGNPSVCLVEGATNIPLCSAGCQIPLMAARDGISRGPLVPFACAALVGREAALRVLLSFPRGGGGGILAI